jgi:hypothetical protein
LNLSWGVMCCCRPWAVRAGVGLVAAHAALNAQ